MLDKLRKKAKNLYKKTPNSNLKNIVDMLEYDNCFFEMGSNVAILVLNDLGFNEEEATKLYIELTNRKYYKENI